MDTPLCLKFQLLGTCGGLIPNNSPTATQPLSLPLLNSTENKLERFMVRINAGRALTSYPHCQNRHSWGKLIYCQFKEVWMVRNKDKAMPSTHLQPIFSSSCFHSQLLCLPLGSCSQLIKQLLAIPPSSCIPLPVWILERH